MELRLYERNLSTDFNFSWAPIHLNCRRVSIHLD